MVDVQCLSDCELRKNLKKFGFSPGPIIPSTRKMYEKKLVQLLASPPCELPVKKRLKKLCGCEDSDDNEDPAVNIILKGNIKFSKDKVKEYKKKPTNEMKWQQADTGKSNCGCKTWKMLIKRPEASTNKRRFLDIYYLNQKPTRGGRCAARPIPRSSHRCVTKEDYCQETQSPESSLLCQSPDNSFPWSLKLAILGIFIIVLFVYITIEKKPLLH